MAMSGTTATFLARRWGKRHVSGGRSGPVFRNLNRSAVEKWASPYPFYWTPCIAFFRGLALGTLWADDHDI